MWCNTEEQHKQRADGWLVRLASSATNRTNTFTSQQSGKRSVIHQRTEIHPSGTTMSAASDITSLKARYEAAGQAHLFTFWDKLSPDEQKSLHSQLAELDVERVNSVYDKAVQADAEAAQMASKKAELGPPPAGNTVSAYIGEGSTLEKELKAIGLQAVAEGQVGVLLMAGGQGTRLGSSAPKGCYDIGLPSHKSLFQLQAERILRLQTLAERAHSKSAGSVKIPWYIMTSGPTRKPTQDFFQEKNYFGLGADNVIFFEQGTLPCLTNEGKIMLDTPSKIATAPDGNGGLYTALRKSLHSATKETVITSLESRKIKFLHCYGVDNCLVRVGDPVFLGACIRSNVPLGVKTVKKTDPAESVGVIALRNGKFNVIEYSELPRELAELRDESGSGELAFRAANIVNHFYTTDFLARQVPDFEHEMAFHIARKKIPTIALDSGEPFKPTTPNGMKLELFVFDVFPFVGKNLTVHEVPRQEEFSPLKNAPHTGSDDPQTSQRDLFAQHKRWLQAAGATVAEGASVEISPLVSYAGEDLEHVKGKVFESTTTLS